MLESSKVYLGYLLYSNCYEYIVAQAPSTGNSKMDIAYRRYGKRHGEEALLAWKRKKKRIAATVKLTESGKDPAYNAKHLQYISKLEQKEDFLSYPDCYVPDCGAESLPHSGYCYKRILYFHHLVLMMYVFYLQSIREVNSHNVLVSKNALFHLHICCVGYTC